jgi:hypothetical protein
MTRDNQFGESITSEETFSTVLQDLLLAAHGNGIDVAGAWEVRSNEAVPDWEAVITTLAKHRDDGVDVASDGGEG